MSTVHLPTDLSPYEGLCLELVDHLLHQHPDGAILYIDLEDEPGPWRYHAALLLDGLVYDAWFPEVRLPPEEYVAEVFGEGVVWEVNPGSEDQ